MKIKVLGRQKDFFLQERKDDIVKVFRNPDPKLHPFQEAREYTRAKNAAKLDRLFAKPFLFALDGHADGVYSMANDPKSLVNIFSGSGDGEIRVWNLKSRKCIWSARGHSGIVTGVCCWDSLVFSCGRDKTVKLWDVNPNYDEKQLIKPVDSCLGKNPFLCIDHHRANEVFATGSSNVDIWDHHRSEPVHSMNWGVDTINALKFNQSELNVLASAASDRSIVLYDIRAKTPINKVVMLLATNSICWNPMNPSIFVTGNEDTNCYEFDMRKLERAFQMHCDHINAVLSVDYSPTGREFVSGSYDKTLRIWETYQIRSREVYYAERMHRIFSVKYSSDNRYVLAGSDDTNIRLWKAVASQPLKTLLRREKNKLDYQGKLIERYKEHTEIRKIIKKRNLPRSLYVEKHKTRAWETAAELKRKRMNRTTKTPIPPVDLRKDRIVQVGGEAERLRKQQSAEEQSQQ